MLKSHYDYLIQLDRQYRCEQRTLRQHFHLAIPLEEFAARLPAKASVQFMVQPLTWGLFDLALAAQLPDGTTQYAWVLNLSKSAVLTLEPLVQTDLQWLKKPVKDAVSQWVYQATAERCEEVPLADSLFGPILPLEPTRTYRVEYSPLIRRSLQVYRWVAWLTLILSTLVFLIVGLKKTSWQATVLGIVLVLLFMVPLLMALHWVPKHGSTLEICDSELPPDFGKKKPWWKPSAGIKHRANINPRYLVRVDKE